VGSCKPGQESLIFVKIGEFCDSLRHCHLIQMYSANEISLFIRCLSWC